MPSFSGKCVGGPYDGRMQTHYATFIQVALRGPDFDFMDLGKEDFEIETKIGRYNYSDGEWRWQT